MLPGRMTCSREACYGAAIATHSPILLAYPGAVIYEFTDSGINPVPYDQALPVTLTRGFLEAPERFFTHLFDDR